MIYLVTAIIAYLIGSVSSSVILSKKMAGFDLREKGSGNAGSTNMLRTVGKKAAVLTLICDIFKGVIAVAIALVIGKITRFWGIDHLIQIAGICVVIGHTFPIFFGFKGGKGVATSLGVLLIMNWRIGLICLIFALAVMALTRMVSLGSILAAVLFPILVLFTSNSYLTGYKYGSSKFSWVVFGIALAAIVIFNHRANLRRILNGEENKLSFKEPNNEGSEESDEEKNNEVAEKVDEIIKAEKEKQENLAKEPENEIEKVARKKTTTKASKSTEKEDTKKETKTETKKTTTKKTTKNEDKKSKK